MAINKRESIMSTRVALRVLIPILAIPFGFGTGNAAVLATGTVSDVTVNQGDIAVYVTAATGSPCGSGWFYSYDSDTDQSTVNRMLTIIEAAAVSGESITLYSGTVTCTSGRFEGANAIVSN